MRAPVRYNENRLYPIRLEVPADDGLVHWAWVKNTVHGPCFYTICDGPRDDRGFRGALKRVFERPNCLTCIASLTAEDNPLWT